MTDVVREVVREAPEQVQDPKKKWSDLTDQEKQTLLKKLAIRSGLILPD